MKQKNMDTFVNYLFALLAESSEITPQMERICEE